MTVRGSAAPGSELNVFGERMDEAGECHCGEPGDRYRFKLGFWCAECAFGVHDTCECSSRSEVAG